MKRVSVVVTEKNDLDGVLNLVGLLTAQTRRPSELIVVDGGSHEKELVKFERRLGAVPFGVKLVAPGRCNISQGRNIGIHAAENDIIAVTDCGCKLDFDWLEKLIDPFEQDEKVDLVAGWYLPDAHTDFERILAAMTLLTLRNVKDESFIPSSRSIAFKKHLWDNAGGYPDDLYTAEDTVFYMKARSLSDKVVIARDAVVRWRPRSTPRGLFKQYFAYSRGDGNASLFPGRYFLRMAVYAVLLGAVAWASLGTSVYPLVVALCAFLLYVWRYASRANKVPVSFPKRLYTALIIIEIIDMSSILGYLYGLADRITGRVEKGRVF